MTMPVDTMSPVVLKPLQCVTNAPADYDYGWTTPLIDNLFTDDRGRSYRLVQVEDRLHFDNQVARYGSGLHATIVKQDDLDYQVKEGWIKPTQPTEQFVYRFAVYDFQNIIDNHDDLIDLLRATEERLEEMEDPRVIFQVTRGGLGAVLKVRDVDSKLFDELDPLLKQFSSEREKDSILLAALHREARLRHEVRVLHSQK